MINNNNNNSSNNRYNADHSYMRLSSGVYIDLLNPKAEDILIEDIAHSLSNQCRFNGHTSEFYSVAQHSVLAAGIAESKHYDPRISYAALLHDAHEAYIGDITTPVKRIIGDQYIHIINNIDAIIEDVFETNLSFYPEVQEIDIILGNTEAKQLLNISNLESEFWERQETFDIEISPWFQETAMVAFIKTFNVLRKALGKELVVIS